MAMINELAPNTTENHQGRMAYVPDDLIPKTVTDAVFDKLQETSLVARLGRSIPVTYGETVIPTTTRRPEVGQVGTGTSNAQREGGTKPLSGTAWDTRSFSPIKLATIVTASSEFAQSNPRGLWTQLQDDLTYAIGRGIDLAVFHGRQPLTGGTLAGIDADNVLANTTNSMNLGAPEDLVDELITGMDLLDPEAEFSDWAVDTRFKTHLLRAMVQRDVNGNIANPQALNLNTTTSQLLGYPVEYGKAVAGDLGLASDSGLKIVGGDYSQLRYGFADEIRFKFSDQATLTDANGQTVSLWQTNQVAILIEVTFGWVVGDLDAFVKYTYTGS